MRGLYDLKTFVVVWPSLDFDVVVKRSVNENSPSGQEPLPSFLSGLTPADAKIFATTSSVLKQLASKFVAAEAVNRASQNLPDNSSVVKENGCFVIDETVRMLHFYAQLYGLEATAREERIGNRNGPPQDVLEFATGNLTGSIVRPTPTMQEFESLDIAPDPNDRANRDFEVRLQGLIESLKNCNNYLRSNQLANYRVACRASLALADSILADSEIVGDVVIPSLSKGVGKNPEAADFFDRFRTYNDLVYTKRDKGLNGFYDSEVTSSKVDYD